jgi:hypothetical protein
MKLDSLPAMLSQEVLVVLSLSDDQQLAQLGVGE